MSEEGKEYERLTKKEERKEEGEMKEGRKEGRKTWMIE